MSEDESGSGAENPAVEGDKFYRGVIAQLFAGSQGGVVRSGNGRQVPFEFEHVLMVGPLRRFDDLRVGMPVGFDVGWTSRGLRVTVLQTAD